MGKGRYSIGSFGKTVLLTVFCFVFCFFALKDPIGNEPVISAFMGYLGSLI